MNHSRTWILLRGLMREQRHWGDFQTLLQQQYPTDIILTPDLPGNGSQNQRQSPMEINLTMEQIRKKIRHDYQPPYHFIALSLGAMVAVSWIDKYPAECKRAILMNTSFSRISPFYQRLKPANYWFIVKMLFNNTIAYRERKILSLTSENHEHDTSLLNQWIKFHEQNPVSRKNALKQLIAAARFRPPKNKPEVPVYLLCGLKDKLVNAKCTTDLAERWQLPVECHPNAGHDLTLDAGHWVIEKISQFIEIKK